MTLANRATPLPPALVGAEVAQDTLTQDEYEAFKAALPSWRDRLICMMLRNTGLRINELLSLPGAHCALGGPSYVIHVVRSKKRKGIETTTVYEPIYINPGLGVRLRDYIKGNNYTMTEPIFGGGDNQRDARKITQRGLRFIFEKTGRESIGRPAPRRSAASLSKRWSTATCPWPWHPRWWGTRTSARPRRTTTSCPRTVDELSGRGFRSNHESAPSVPTVLASS